VDTTFSATSQDTDRPLRRRGRLTPRPLDVLLPASLALWAFGVSRVDISGIGPYGLLNVLPVVFYLGLALLVVSAGLELTSVRPSELRLGLHAGALVVMLYGTAPLVYPEGRYAWLYKTIGVVQYVGAHGQLNRAVDIYQNWPGFFAFAAWFDKIAGVGSALDYAKWSQPVVELAVLPLLYAIYKSVALPVRQRWTAIMLYSAVNWIGQDYFSPQALGTLFSLGIMALMLRWMFVGNFAGPRSLDDAPPERLGPERRDSRLRRSLPYLAALLLMFALTASHEISPYIVAIQLTALTAVGLLRPRWIAFAAAAIAVGYLLPNFSYVNSHYGLLASAGSFMGNVRPPATCCSGVTPHSQSVLNSAADALSLGVWLLALLGAWKWRKSLRTVIALLFLTYSPIIVLVGGAYGGEGVLRVYLFSLPWAAALAAAALSPLPSLSAERPRKTNSATAFREVLGGLNRAWRAPLALLIAMALFLPSFYGGDLSMVMSKSEVDTLEAFQQTVRPGPILCPIANAPLADTARYDQFPIGQVFGPYSVMGLAPVTPGIATYLARTMVNYLNGNQPGYIVITPSMAAYNVSNGVTRPSSYKVFLASLANSRYWKLLVNRQGTLIYQLSSTSRGMPAGPYDHNPGFEVP
jgi:hypothetical protein